MYDEIEFNDTIREYLIVFLIWLCLYLIAFVTMTKYRINLKSERLYTGRSDDTLTYWIIFFTCSVILSFVMLSALLLPVSIASSQFLISDSTIRNLWDLIFILFVFSLHVLIPFSYFLLESSGRVGPIRGFLSRVAESFIMLILSGTIISYLVAFVHKSFLNSVDLTDEFKLFYTLCYLAGLLFNIVCVSVGFRKVLSGNYIFRASFVVLCFICLFAYIRGPYFFVVLPPELILRLFVTLLAGSFSIYGLYNMPVVGGFLMPNKMDTICFVANCFFLSVVSLTFPLFVMIVGIVDSNRSSHLVGFLDIFDLPLISVFFSIVANLHALYILVTHLSSLPPVDIQNSKMIIYFFIPWSLALVLTFDLLTAYFTILIFGCFLTCNVCNH